MSDNNNKVDAVMIALGLFLQTVERNEEGAWEAKAPEDLPNPELRTISAISKHAGCSSAALSKRLAKMGIPTDVHQGRSAAPLPEGEELESLVEFYELGNSLAATGNEFGLSPQRAREAIVGAGGQIRSAGRAGMDQPEKDVLLNAYETGGETVSGAADELFEVEVQRLVAEGHSEDVARKSANRPSDSTVSKWLDAEGIREKGTRQRYVKISDDAPEFGTAPVAELQEWADAVGFPMDDYDPETDRTGFIIAALTFISEQ